MILHIKKELAEAIGVKKLIPFGISEETWHHRESREIDLARLTPSQLTHLESLLKGMSDLKGIGLLLRDLNIWNTELLTGRGKARTVEQFSTLLHRYLAAVPGHRLYKKNASEVWLAYYVNKIVYHPQRSSQNGTIPAYVEMVLLYEEFRGLKGESVRFHREDCLGEIVPAILRHVGYHAEQPALRELYLLEAAEFGAVVDQIGKQYWATGTATDDLDGNPSSREESWYWRTTHTYEMLRDEQPSRVVVDVFYEAAKERGRENDRIYVDAYYWTRPSNTAVSEDDDWDEDADEHPERTIEVPIHPFVPVFDLARHLRLRIHVSHLTEYVYDLTLAKKLVLPAEQKALVKVLIEHKEGAFKDIVRGKGGGAVVLLCGPPGTGKTLTAEVYAESEQRALYSVQCSQLGIDPDDLEEALLKVFMRAKRWHAVMLLDEADVYVHERGNNLTQNAIVGVFLRVLEYQGTVLFLTTNRPEDVDDAIASRCIARFNYTPPDAANQTRIWEVLAGGTGAEIHQHEIDAIVRANPGITGRDVKNLLKLAVLIRKEAPIRAQDIAYVKQFKPTGGRIQTETTKREH